MIDGVAAGVATRARAREARRPVGYQVAIDNGWYWAARGSAVPHLVPPNGDRAMCGAELPRDNRQQVTTGIAERGCRRCFGHAGIEARQ